MPVYRPVGDTPNEFNERMNRAHGRPNTQRKPVTHGPDEFTEKDAAFPNRKYVHGNDKPIRGSSVVDLATGVSISQDDDERVQTIELGNGSVVIDLNPFAEMGDVEESGGEEDNSFYTNLALKLNESELSVISAELVDGIRQDEESRKDVLETRRKGIKLLGLQIEEPRGDTGTSSAPLEGMSTVRHSLLLEAATSFQAGARAELLPSEGPVKIRNDAPSGAPSSAPGQPPQGLGEQPLDELANALEIDMNHYLTVTASEYVPDTDRMLFTVGFSGDGFKKLYRDPLKQRPMSLSVDPEDLIVSNMATDLESCGRVTHRVRMRKSILRRMQIVGAYRDIPLHGPAVPEVPDAVKQEIADTLGAKPEPMRPKDIDYTLYECYTELDIDEFAPAQFKGKALPLPYRVTIEKDSHQILEISRNWKPDDPLCQPRSNFVQYPFIPALGFYSLGFLHLLGNTTLALTAATREMLDAGMFANFPGFVYAKQVGRQLTNQFRCPPGGGIAIELPAGAKVTDVIMPLPYKEVGPAFPQFLQHLEQNGRQLAMVANSPVSEGKQDAPVGTTLALIEQSTKVLGSAFKRLHIAQAREFKILKELFQEDPAALWRHGQKSRMMWSRGQFIAALAKYELVPVADPNNPTSLHRMAKAAMLKTLQTANPQIYDPIAVDRRILTMAAIDPEGLFKGPAPQGPDPMMMLMQARMQMAQLQLAIKDKELQIKAATAAMQQQGKAADRSSQERIEILKQQIVQEQQQASMIMDRLKLNADMIMHVHGGLAKQMTPAGHPIMMNDNAQQQLPPPDHTPTSTGANH